MTTPGRVFEYFRGCSPTACLIALTSSLPPYSFVSGRPCLWSRRFISPPPPPLTPMHALDFYRALIGFSTPPPAARRISSLDFAYSHSLVSPAEGDKQDPCIYYINPCDVTGIQTHWTAVNWDVGITRIQYRRRAIDSQLV